MATQTDVFRFHSLRAWSDRTWEWANGKMGERENEGITNIGLYTFAGREEELSVLWVNLELIDSITMTRE